MVFLKDILNHNIERLLNFLEKKRIQELVDILGTKREILKRNFIAGIFRGIGFGIGVTIITAVTAGPVIQIFANCIRAQLNRL